MNGWPTHFTADAHSPVRGFRFAERTDHPDEAIALRDGALWIAPEERHLLRIRCASGFVWLTQEGRAEDIVIGPGEMHVAPRKGKVVVQALEDAVLHLEG